MISCKEKNALIEHKHPLVDKLFSFCNSHYLYLERYKCWLIQSQSPKSFQRHTYGRSTPAWRIGQLLLSAFSELPPELELTVKYWQFFNDAFLFILASIVDIYREIMYVHIIVLNKPNCMYLKPDSNIVVSSQFDEMFNRIMNGVHV